MKIYTVSELTQKWDQEAEQRKELEQLHHEQVEQADRDSKNAKGKVKNLREAGLTSQAYQAIRTIESIIYFNFQQAKQIDHCEYRSTLRPPVAVSDCPICTPNKGDSNAT